MENRRKKSYFLNLPRSNENLMLFKGANEYIPLCERIIEKPRGF